MRTVSHSQKLPNRSGDGQLLRAWMEEQWERPIGAKPTAVATCGDGGTARREQTIVASPSASLYIELPIAYSLGPIEFARADSRPIEDPKWTEIGGIRPISHASYSAPD